MYDPLYTSKEREWYHKLDLGYTRETFGSSLTTKVYEKVYSGTDNLDFSEYHFGPPYHQGGGFRVRNAHVSFSLAPDAINYVQSVGSNLTYKFVGHFVPTMNATGIQGLQYDDYQLLVHGTTGYARYRPGHFKEDANLGQFLFELRDLPRLPRLLRNVARIRPKTRSGKSRYRTIPEMVHQAKQVPSNFRKLDFFQELGSEYLNGTFGWAPFIKDLQSSVGCAVVLHEHLHQLARDNGRDIRREGPVSSANDHVLSGDSGPAGTFPPVLPAISQAYMAGPWRREIVTRTREDYWFSGKFRYWSPDVGSSRWTRQATGALFGLNVTPATIYSVLPWSWLLDWVGNMDDVMSNISANAAENLVAKYAYIMQHRNISEERTVYFQTRTGPKVCSIKLERESKARDMASPYGFGLSWTGFSPKQVAILTALGMSRTTPPLHGAR